MTDLAGILRRPVVTERSTQLKAFNQYVFEVDPKATKGQIKEALKEAFQVDVVKVHTILLPGKFRRRMGPWGGYQSDRKKALVTLPRGQEIRWEEPR